MAMTKHFPSNSEPAPDAAPSQGPPAASTAVEEPPAPTRSKPKPTPDHRVDQLPPYRVLLHNDDHNEHFAVVRAIVELTPLTRPRAIEVMFEAERTGVSLLLVTHKERAELYQEQFTSKRLTVTIEPA